MTDALQKGAERLAKSGAEQISQHPDLIWKAWRKVIASDPGVKALHDAVENVACGECKCRYRNSGKCDACVALAALYTWETGKP